jgi:hypothetical protein
LRYVPFFSRFPGGGQRDGEALRGGSNRAGADQLAALLGPNTAAAGALGSKYYPAGNPARAAGTSCPENLDRARRDLEPMRSYFFALLSASWWSIIGLAASLIGVLLLFRYGMPYRTRRDGATLLVLQQTDEKEREAEKRYSILG